MNADAYLTVEGVAQAKLVEKKSTFLSFVHPVQTEDAVESLLRQYRKKYYDARHVCYAYMLQEVQSAKGSDNGEPSGTAARPMLGVLQGRGLRCVLVIVVRYFGGIKLGTSGLAAAYRQATELALEAAVIVEQMQEESWKFTFPYGEMNRVMQAIKADAGLRTLQSSFDLQCRVQIEGPRTSIATLKGKLSPIVTEEKEK